MTLQEYCKIPLSLPSPVKIRSGSLPCMNSSIRKELNKRYNLLIKAQRTPKGSEACLDYKKVRNHCTKLLRSAESKYWLTKFNDANSSKDFGRTVRSFEERDVSSKIDPVKDKDRVIYTDDTSKANTLNSFYVNTGKTLAQPSHQAASSPTNQIVRNNQDRPTLSSIALDKDILKSSFLKTFNNWQPDWP